ncbi:hypothetical protein [Agreia sp. COWG]|uniref:hypothetical protein n=1 Tax=Agreia sp. COWG TaxID=2773266 RepID=UPI001AF277EC|nr:hypothetical protein [Agreia sp. COWG]CAD5989796.1 exported protein of unknown function [Agreia sp. COWG]
MSLSALASAAVLTTSAPLASAAPLGSTASLGSNRVAAAASDNFLGVDWGAFAIVFIVAFAASVLIVCCYALALRLLATGSVDDTGADGSIVSGARGERPIGATVGGFACLAVCVAAVLYGLYLIIPQFH